jgi:hypothetical protein
MTKLLIFKHIKCRKIISDAGTIWFVRIKNILGKWTRNTHFIVKYDKIGESVYVQML